ncbi:MAG: hypothetical protein LAO08_07225 [Acidobacteriia bacterium]|nr:hypothetical protein [Terriglobia bacterium]
MTYWGIKLGASTTRVRRFASQFLLGMLLVMTASLVACGTGSGQQGGSAGGTPAGMYPVVVTATSGTDVHTTTLTLTVM